LRPSATSSIRWSGYNSGGSSNSGNRRCRATSSENLTKLRDPGKFQLLVPPKAVLRTARGLKNTTFPAALATWRGEA
jgi:hypothetical protein